MPSHCNLLSSDIGSVHHPVQHEPVQLTAGQFIQRDAEKDSSKGLTKIQKDYVHCYVDASLCLGEVTQFFLLTEIAVFAGKKGSAIENFSCVIYDVSLMNCTWQAGRNAPGDTQYFLYWKNSR